MYTILVCDDEKDIVSALNIYLSAEGYRVLTAYDGYQALRLLDREEVHLILLDVMMPGMDGIETARRIRAIVGPEVTIIIMTAYDWVAIEHEAKLAGVNLLMSKPMFKSSLVSAFSRALGEKEQQAQQRCGGPPHCAASAPKKRMRKLSSPLSSTPRTYCASASAACSSVSRAPRKHSRSYTTSSPRNRPGAASCARRT